jgi:acetyltransferase
MGPELRTVVPDGFAQLWIANTAAGGAAGFTTYTPEAEIVAAAEAAMAEVAAGREHVIVAVADGVLVGTVFLQPGAGERFGHRGTVRRLLVHPDLQGTGLGAALLDAVVRHARDLGLEQLILGCRGGTGLPAYYTRRGWTEVGRVPNGLRFAGGERRDEHFFQISLVG